MSAQMSEEELYQEAKERVEDKKGFFIHLGIYILINAMLILIWAFATGDDFPWFIFPLIFWGFAVLAHYLTVFRTKGLFTERMVEDEYRKLKKEKRKT